MKVCSGKSLKLFELERHELIENIAMNDQESHCIVSSLCVSFF